MSPEEIDRMFAPWRLAWVTRENNNEGSECVFCDYAASNQKDRENRVVARTPHSFTLVNHAPYNPGHVMVIPREHTGDYSSLDESIVADHSVLIQKTIEVLNAVFSPGGFNTGMNIGQAGGASIVDHVHAHIVPRWTGDTNFMPTTANTKVIVQALDDTSEYLREMFAERNDTYRNGSEEAVVVEV